MVSETKTLICGERRLLAIKELYAEGFTIRYDSQEVPDGQLPFTRVADASEVELLEMEYDENFWRENLTWQERSQAYVRIHELKLLQNPKQTLIQTGAEILARKALPVTPEAAREEGRDIGRMRSVVENLSNPVVANAPNMDQAYKAYLDDAKRKLERDLIRLNPTTSPHTLIQGDYRNIHSTLGPGTFDAIIFDPPYGINAHTAGSGALQHRYDDTPTYALDFCRLVFQTGFHLLKPMGTIFMFCDIEHFITLRTMAEQQAFSTFRTPLVWRKGTEGHAPWGREGPKRTYELLLYCVKGQRSLALPFGPDIIDLPRSTVDPDRVHAAEKPVGLLRFLVSKALRAGDRILDPCCGSGPIFAAVQNLSIHVTGVEIDTEYYTLAASRLARLAAGEESIPDVGVVHQEDFTDIMSNLKEANNAAE